jgi:hypothetical protein
MFSTLEIALIVGFAAVTILVAFVASRISAGSDQAIDAMRAEREADSAKSAPRAPVPAARGKRKRR